MAFVGDDEIEGLDGDRGILETRAGSNELRAEFLAGQVF
jgi:hypothetical protein